MMPLVMVGIDAFWLVTHMYEFTLCGYPDISQD